MGNNKNIKNMKPPSYATEFIFISTNLLFLKLYSENSYMTTSYFSVCLPMMAYFVITLLGNLIKFIQFMHIEDQIDDGSILTRKQSKLLLKVLINLMSYFGLYFISAQLDQFVKTSDDFDKI
jgi:hypothetical protein